MGAPCMTTATANYCVNRIGGQNTHYISIGRIYEQILIIGCEFGSDMLGCSVNQLCSFSLIVILTTQHEETSATFCLLLFQFQY